MHFAFAITEYFPFGGAQRDFYFVVEAMAKRGHQISVITLGWHGDKPSDWQLYELEKNQATNHGRIRALSNYVVSLKQQGLFDYVVGFTKLAGLDVYFAADPCFTANRYRGLKRLLPRYRTYAAIEKTLFETAHLHSFFLTQHQQDQYQTSFGLNPNNNYLLPVSVGESFHYSAEKFAAARQWRKQYEQDTGRFLLLFVAADFNTKGLDRVIAALARLSEQQQSHFELWIVGNGKQSAYENKLNMLRQLRFTFWGGQTDLAPFYFAADYLVHPARKEAAGMVLAEAAAARLPMLISDVCGYGFLAEQDKQSMVLDDKVIVHDLAKVLSGLTSSLPVRSDKNLNVSASSRAELCADQIETWCHG
ncbi:UDP-glucose:(heptosyl) LPS alpha1,3-glucosyltransferase WaaG [Methylophaga thiooxydans]|uniref:UDP-glucose:(Heptosyl) LPS alpha1,3-glucosyltransferase WaaG n=1 Tax=Methylophaga thiooxydans TaxID=392484 RepID=A0A0A0BJG4_9GAMM|nr:glycosyltransferase family 4 protein [Methylophaga thiooxydans]KGM08131.1 UDP-glucose:(heptosyl) LPS alpha1,3-glucosyltransferase WaaG [Methylophaga thiooxydans]